MAAMWQALSILYLTLRASLRCELQLAFFSSIGMVLELYCLLASSPKSLRLLTHSLNLNLMRKQAQACYK